jgi:hypothetical protein
MADKKSSAVWKRPAGDGGPEPPPLLPPPEAEAEDSVLMEAFRSALLADLRPVGALQVLLAERIVLSLWRSMRGSDAPLRPRRMVYRWIDPVSKLCYERVEFDAPAEAAVPELRADAARADASIARQLRKDLESLGAMQGRVIGSLRPPAESAESADAGARCSDRAGRRSPGRRR